MTSAEVYEKTLQGYWTIPASTRKSLSRYCRDLSVSYQGLRYWMQKNGLSVVRSKQPDQVFPVLPSITPLTILPPRPTDSIASFSSSDSILKGVKISLPTGVHVCIREINSASIPSLLHSLNLR